VDEQLAALKEQLASAQAREAALKEELAAADTALTASVARARAVQTRLTGRLRALYVLGEGGAVRALIGAESFEDLSYRRRLVENLAKSDAALVREHARVSAEVKAQRAARAAKVSEAARTRTIIEEQTELVAATLSERRAAIARIENEKELQVRAVREIVDRQRALGGLLFEVQKKSGVRKRRGRGVLKAGLLWPVRGTVLRRFGTIRERNTGARITSNGVDIRAPLGTPVIAGAEGTVVHVGWLRGFGRIVILDHGEGHHTLHAHLDRAAVSRGQDVGRGEVIGTVGETESLNGPKLYFELRGNSRPMDPLPYLR
jgi:septal ring factor EnvC (AmiA/AmiB activator)